MGFCNKSRRSAVSSYVGHESLPLLQALRKVVISWSSLTSVGWGRKIAVPGVGWAELHPCLDII